MIMFDSLVPKKEQYPFDISPSSVLRGDPITEKNQTSPVDPPAAVPRHERSS